MSYLFRYRDEELYSHHSLDEHPLPEEFPMHAHEWMEIYYFLSGTGTYRVEGHQYPLEPGDILILRAAETHKLSISPEAPYERIAFHFYPQMLAAFDPTGRLLRPFLERPLGRYNRYPATADPDGRLRAAFSHFEFDGVPDVRLNLIARLVQFLTVLEGRFDAGGAAKAPGKGLQSQVVGYVNAHLFEDISLQTVADHFYRSRSQISRIFHQATGSSLWEYVSIKRLLAARAMIQRGESANTAASACGFADYSSFFRAYKAQFGHAPTKDATKL